MATITSKLSAPNTYTAHDAIKRGKCPSVTVNPGANDITDKQLALLRKVPAYVAHVEGGYIVEGKAPTKAEAAAKAQAEAEAAEAAAKAQAEAEAAEAAAKAQAEAEAAAQQLDEATKLAEKGGK